MFSQKYFTALIFSSFVILALIFVVLPPTSIVLGQAQNPTQLLSPPESISLLTQEMILEGQTNNRVTNMGTGLINKYLYGMGNIGASAIPVQVSPNGTISDTTPTFKWGAVSNASKYELAVYRGTSLVVDKVVTSYGCSGNYCSYTQPSVLNEGAYKWRIRCYVGTSWSSYSGYKYFSISTSFISDFTSNSTGWSIVKGTWSLASGTYQTRGTLYKTVSAIHTNNYPTLDYTVIVKRTLDKSGANRIIIYGTPTPLFGTYHWYQGFTFQYTNDQQFMIYRTLAGSEIILVKWTPSNYINAFGWNKIRITAKANLLKFYINDNLVAYGTDTSLSNGKVGFGMFQNVANSPFYVDYARVVTTVTETSISEASIPANAVTFSMNSAETIDLDRSPAR